MDMYPQKSVYIIIANASNSSIELSQRKSVTTTISHLSKNIHIRNDKLSSYLTSSMSFKHVNILHYTPTPDRPQQMEEHETVQ